MRSPQQTAPDLHPTNPDPRLAEIRARKADRRAIRAEFAARRQRALEYRHAQRLHNLAVARQQATERGEPPPTNLTSHRTPTNSLTTTQPAGPSADALPTMDHESDAERARPPPAQVADCAASAGGRASSGHGAPDSEQVPMRLGRDVGRAQPAVRPSPIRPPPIREGSAGPLADAVSATDHESAAEQARPPPGQLATCGTSANGQAAVLAHTARTRRRRRWVLANRPAGVLAGPSPLADRRSANAAPVHRPTRCRPRTINPQRAPSDRVIDLHTAEDDPLLEQLVVRVGLLHPVAGAFGERRQHVPCRNQTTRSRYGFAGAFGRQFGDSGRQLGTTVNQEPG
jgi:hypothetical protein